MQCILVGEATKHSFLRKQNKSVVKILKSRGPRIELCGTLDFAFLHWLNILRICQRFVFVT